MEVELKSGKFINGDFFSVCNEIKAKLVITDIPYGEVNRTSGGLRALDKGIADVANFDVKELVNAIANCATETAYIFCGINQISEITIGMQRFGFSTRLGQWEKSNPSPMNGNRLWLSGSEFCVFARKPNATFNRHCEKPIWKYPVGQNKIHPTQKPVKLFEYLIESSSNEGDLVFDPFAGSGTTAEACIKLNRKWLCVEKNEIFFKAAIDRIKKFKEPI